VDGRLLDAVCEKTASGSGGVDMPDVGCEEGVAETK
jgi:hypothetical protein